LVYTINELGKHLNNNEISNLYLLYGEETYLKEYYRDSIIDEIKKTEGSSIEIVKVSSGITVNELYNLVDTSSMFGSSKIIIFKNTGWFKNDAKEDIFEKFSFLMTENTGCYLIFLEDSAAKNRKLYKLTEKNGICVEMNYQSGEMKEKWIAKQFLTNGFKVDKSLCKYIADNCEPDFLNLKNDIDKLCLAKNPGDTVTFKDVDGICIKILSSKIFALTDAITAQNASKALKVTNDLLSMGEPMERIYFMIARYFRLLKQTKELVNDGVSSTAGILKINPYEASQFMKSSSKYSMACLKEAEEDCLNYDIARKNGSMDYETATQILIAKYCNRTCI